MTLFKSFVKSIAAPLTIAALTTSAAFAGTWEVTVSSTNSKSPTMPSIPSTTSFYELANSTKTMSFLQVGAFSATSGTETGSAQAAYSGTWTFTWHPDNSSDWPSAYAITRTKLTLCQAAMKNGSGTAHVFFTGGADIATVTLPNTASSVLDMGTPSVTTDTSDSNLTITTTTVTSHVAGAIPSGWQDFKRISVVTKRDYTASYFTAHFTTPSSVVLSFTCDSSDVSAGVSYNSSSSSSLATTSAIATEMYSGQ